MEELEEKKRRRKKKKRTNLSQESAVGEGLSADWAGVGLLAAVRALMHAQVGGGGKGVAALATDERPLARVLALVLGEAWLPAEAHPAVVTRVPEVQDTNETNTIPQSSHVYLKSRTKIKQTQRLSWTDLFDILYTLAETTPTFSIFKSRLGKHRTLYTVNLKGPVGLGSGALNLI